MKDISFLRKGLIAHRGYHDKKKGIIENSIESFKRAIAYKYIIELDVHMLNDGNIVVFHDSNLKRICGVNKVIENCSYDEIKNYKLFNTESKIPLLSDVLKLVDGKVPLLIEIKKYYKYGVLEKKLTNMLRDYNGKVAVQSFYPKTIFWFKKNARNIPIGLLTSDFKNSSNNLKRLIGKTILLDIILKSDFISYDINAIPNLYINSKKKKKFILGWTIKDKKTYEKGITYFDNLICENMDRYAKT